MDNNGSEGGDSAEVIGSCNDLIALLNSDEDLALCNPWTGKFKRIPDSDIESPNDFHICGCPIFVFGHDLINHDYKVFRLAIFEGIGFNGSNVLLNMKSRFIV